jgi:hypothetical protein
MEPILKYFIAGGVPEDAPRQQQLPFAHPGYKSDFIFGGLSEEIYPLEFSALHKPCVSESFIQQVEGSDCLTYWREVKNDSGHIRDLVMVLCDATKSQPIDAYLNSTDLMEAGDPSFKALIRGHDSVILDIGTLSIKVFFVIVDKKANQKNVGRRLTEILSRPKGIKLPAVEITLTSKERGVMICASEEEREAQIENLSQNADLGNWNGPIKLDGKSRTHVLDTFATYEIALNWLSAYYVARGWRSHLQHITSPSEFQELDHISKSFAHRYTVQRLKKTPIIKQGTFDFVIARQVDKLLNGEDIAVLNPSMLSDVQQQWR